MDDKDFRKHLKDLAHGHHHPEEHDWAPQTDKPAKTKSTAKPRVKASRRRAK
jgi:hypothetical protein